MQKGTNLILAKAATCGHLRPLALAATYTCGHLLWRPLAATRLAASGCKWLQVVADEKSMRAATGGHSSGCKWLQVAADEKPNAGGRWRPLEWLQVAAENVEKFPWEDVRRPLAATCGHSSGCTWLQMDAISKIKLRASCVLNGNFDN